VRCKCLETKARRRKGPGGPTGLQNRLGGHFARRKVRLLPFSATMAFQSLLPGSAECVCSRCDSRWSSIPAKTQVAYRRNCAGEVVMKVQTAIITVLFFVLLFQACAMHPLQALFHGRTESVEMESSPPGAQVEAPDGASCVTPCALELTRGQSYVLMFRRQGCRGPDGHGFSKAQLRVHAEPRGCQPGLHAETADNRALGRSAEKRSHRRSLAGWAAA
jgi:hypothetical protein